MTCAQADVGLIGLAVMGQNLVLNMNDKGFTVAVYNRTVSKVDDFLKNEAKGTKVIGSQDIASFVKLLKVPRKIVLLVKAGEAVDAFIAQLMPFLSQGDIIIDGGNSEFRDSERRYKDLKEKGLLFVGSGVSGGEEGARNGPSLMPGGHDDAWPHIKPIFQAIAAKVENNVACCDWCGSGGSGHFVKMVHNGIEYGDMQLISEAYHVLRDVLKCSYDEMAGIFKEWNKGELDSFLIEITADALAYKDTDGQPLVEKILDKAGQKGTGRWTVINGLELACPITLIAESVFSRSLSSLKSERVGAEKILSGPATTEAISATEKAQLISDIGNAIYAAKLVSYAQGFMMLQQAKHEYGWNVSLGAVALMWRGGCIIRSRFLGDIKAAFDVDPNLQNLLVAPFVAQAMARCHAGWRRVVSKAVLCGIPVPALSSALAFYDGYRSSRLPANLIQAQRDYFGAHQYELLSNPGTFVHTNWTGRGGSTASSTYQG